MSEEKKNKFEKEREKAEKNKALKQSIIAEMKGNKAMMDYLHPYKEDDVEIFIERYAEKKVRLLEWGPHFLEWQQKAALQWVEDAWERLEEIQQKKLFDLQCLWRAEAIELEGVTITFDFTFWEKNIFNCPFLDTVTEDEISMYQRYLQGNNFEEKQGFLESWQDYDEIKEAYQSNNANRNFPEWYDFYNGLTGKAVLLTLPDLRGEKEEYYKDFAREEMHQQNKLNRNTEAVTATLPDIKIHEPGLIKWFVTTFDTAETQKHFFNYLDESDADDESDEEHINGLVEFLSSDAEVFPIKGWYNWREALQKCADEYQRYKIAETLPLAYEQYCLYKDNGLAYPNKHGNNYEWLRKFNMDLILRGRLLAGEPQDLNF